MKNKSLFFFSVILLIGCNINVFSQSKATPSRSEFKTILGSYSMSNGAGGAQDVVISMDYQFYRESTINGYSLCVYIKINSYEYTQGAGGKRYKYDNTIYTADQLQSIDSRGQDCFDNITITDAHIVGLKVAGFSKEISDQSLLHTTCGIGEISETRDLNTLFLSNTSASLKYVTSRNTECLIQRINNYNKGIKNRNSYKEYIQAADQAFNSNNWKVAKSKYEQASQLFPNENYPNNQLQKIKQEEDKLAAAKNTTNQTTGSSNSGSSNQNQSTGNTNNNTAGQGSNNTTSNTNNGAAKSNTNVQAGGITNMSGTVKVNGEDAKVYEQNGKHYMQSADGTTREINQQSYEKVQQASNNNIANKEKYENDKKAAELAQAEQAKKNHDDYLAKVAASNAKAEQTKVIVESAVQLMNTAAPLIEEWAANRERRWAAERAAYAKHQLSVNENKAAYSLLVSSTNDFLFKDQNNYQTMLKLSLPNILTLPPITWEEALGTKDYNGYFGKNVSYVSNKTKEKSIFLMDNSLASDLKNNKVERVIPNPFTPQTLRVVDHDNSMYYWVKTDFFDHQTEFIFDDNNIMVGTRLKLFTDRQDGQIHIKDYYDDLIKNLGDKYFMASGNTFVTNDKIFVLDFYNLDIYDLNYLNPNTLFNFPNEFNTLFNPNNCFDCINQIGVKIQGTKSLANTVGVDVEIKEVLQNSLAENKLLAGDIILKINEVLIKHPYQVQWYFYGFPFEKTINITIKRANKTEVITITL